MCDVGYLCANFSLPIGLSVLDLSPMYAMDRRQTSDAHHRLIPLALEAGIINSRQYCAYYIGNAILTKETECLPPELISSKSRW